jgi:hypothetical protein
MPSAEKTIGSGLDAVDWVAKLVSEPRGRPDRAQITPWVPPVVPPAQEDAPEGDDGAPGFWDARPELAYVREYARSKYVAPWAVLGALLARLVASVEPNIQLPAIIGSEASLNLYVGLVGPSGGGKDIAFGVARRMLEIRHGHDVLDTDVIPLGSGEGLSHVYMKQPPKLTARRKKTDDDSAAIGLGVNPDSDTPIQYRTRALVTISEIDTLDAIGQRRGSTLGGQLRQAWSGSQLGFQYVDAAKRMIVPEHAYRLCIVAGIQPGRAGGLLAETDGGTPQRFLWLPATDPTMEREAPATPAGQLWQPPVYGSGRVMFDVCSSASDVITDAHIARNRGDGDALDGHALLSRLKVAAALAMLTGQGGRRQCTVTEEDWVLAGQVMAVSDGVRAGVQRHLAEVAKVENEKKAVAEGRRTVVIAETVEDDGMRKALRWLRGRIGADWVTHAVLKGDAKSSVRKHLADALERLAAAGEIEVGNYTTSNGQVGRQVRRALRDHGE